MERIEAPFTPEQVMALNRFQTSGEMHPFTCGNRDEHPDDPGILVAVSYGWICPARCDYEQSWAHDFMAATAPPPVAGDVDLRRIIADYQRLLRGMVGFYREGGALAAEIVEVLSPAPTREPTPLRSAAPSPRAHEENT